MNKLNFFLALIIFSLSCNENEKEHFLKSFKFLNDSIEVSIPEQLAIYTDSLQHGFEANRNLITRTYFSQDSSSKVFIDIVNLYPITPLLADEKKIVDEITHSFSYGVDSTLDIKERKVKKIKGRTIHYVQYNSKSKSNRNLSYSSAGFYYGSYKIIINMIMNVSHDSLLNDLSTCVIDGIKLK